MLTVHELQIYIWDLNDPSKPYGPGSRSTKLDEITALAWNRYHKTPHVLASSSNTGYTVVWDLKGKREILALQYNGSNQPMHMMGGGGRKGMSDVAWHPDNVRHFFLINTLVTFKVLNFLLRLVGNQAGDSVRG